MNTFVIWSHRVNCWFHVSGPPVCSSQACCSTSSSPSPSWKTPSWFQHLLRRWNHVTLLTSHLLHIAHTLSSALAWGEENKRHLPSCPTLLFCSVMLAIGSFVQTHVIRLFSLMENGFRSSVAVFFDLLCWNSFISTFSGQPELQSH